jgi:hypothetical protein
MQASLLFSVVLCDVRITRCNPYPLSHKSYRLVRTDYSTERASLWLKGRRGQRNSTVKSQSSQVLRCFSNTSTNLRPTLILWATRSCLAFLDASHT